MRAQSRRRLTKKCPENVTNAHLPQTVTAASGAGAIAIRPIGARSRPSAERRNIADRGLAIIARAVGGDLGRCRLIGLGCAGVTKKFSPSVPRIASRCRGLAAFKKPDRPSASNPDISCATNDHAALSWSVTYF